MKIVLKTRYPIPLHRIVLLLLFVLAGSYFHYQGLPKKNTKSKVEPDLMAVLPIRADLRFKTKPPEPVSRNVEIQRNQTFSELMESEGIDGTTIQEIHATTKEVYNLNQIHAGRSMEITTIDNAFVKLEYSIDPLRTLLIEKETDVMHVEVLEHPVQTAVKELGGVIEGSLYNTIDQLGEEDELIIRFAEIFEWDIDFFKDLHAGDTFRVVYEKQFVRGESYGYGKILAAELINKGKNYTAIGFQRGNNWEFFSPDGKAMKKAFLASPLKFNRISSGFSRSRYHPVLRGYRPHYGVDYAAPAGTPVRSIGKGRVVFAGSSGGAGRMIKIQHNNEIATSYCHLSRFAGGIKKGASVSQGQIIGYVGSTGLATGPHLDFRFMKNGKYVNFLSVKSPQADPLTPSELVHFQASSQEIAHQLQQVELRQPPPEYVYMPPNGLEFSEYTY